MFRAILSPSLCWPCPAPPPRTVYPPTNSSCSTASTINTYPSYRIDSDFTVIQDFNISQGGQVFDAQRVEFIRQENGTYVAGEPSPNVAQHMLVSEVFTPDSGILEGAVRVVDSTSYVQAAYSLNEPYLPALNDAGGFADYAPFDELTPRSSTVILLR